MSQRLYYRSSLCRLGPQRLSFHTWQKSQLVSLRKPLFTRRPCSPSTASRSSCDPTSERSATSSIWSGSTVRNRLDRRAAELLLTVVVQPEDIGRLLARPANQPVPSWPVADIVEWCSLAKCAVRIAAQWRYPHPHSIECRGAGESMIVGMIPYSPLEEMS